MTTKHKKTGKQWSSNQRKVEALNPTMRYKRTTAFESVIKPQQMKDIEDSIKAQVKIAKKQEADANIEKPKRIRKNNPK